MPGGRKKKPRPPAGDPTDPQGMPALLALYLERLHVKNYSAGTIKHAAFAQPGNSNRAIVSGHLHLLSLAECDERVGSTAEAACCRNHETAIETSSTSRG